jgi:hypothetical protein
MSQVMEHVNQLAEIIGPRPATTDAEASAADYIEDVFAARGLDVQRQEFDAPRTDSWPIVICSALTLAAILLVRWKPLAGAALAVTAAVLAWLERDARPGLSRVLPKGPSQNIIARHVPRARRGDRLKRVVIVAHYDTAKPSLLSGPGMVKYQHLSEQLTWWVTVAVPVVIVLFAMPFAKSWTSWSWYATLAVGAYLLIPLLVALHRELLMHATDGANDNASGVAAMLEVMSETVPVEEGAGGRTQPLRRSAAAAYEADVVVEDAILDYRDVDEGFDLSAPVAGPAPGGFGDVSWETGPLGASAAPSRFEEPSFSFEEEAGETPEPEPVRPAAYIPAEDVPPAAPSGAPAVGAGWSDDLVDETLWDEPAPPRRPAIAPLDLPVVRRDTPGDDEAGLPATPGRAEDGQDMPARRAPAEGEDEEPPASGRRSRRGKAPRGETPEEAEEAEGKSLRDWLGIGRGFDVRKAGKEIANWDNIDDEDEFGFKAGTAGDEWGGSHQTEDVAARIRRRVTESVDRSLSEKEIWFVATGAHEPGAWGMRAFLDAFESDLKDAFIINIDTVGVGTVAYVSAEGRGRSHRADRRLTSQAKRTAREAGLSIKSESVRGMLTDATPALARHLKAMSVMAFDINGRLPYRHQADDTADAVSEATIEQATAFVSALVRDL